MMSVMKLRPYLFSLLDSAAIIDFVQESQILAPLFVSISSFCKILIGTRKYVLNAKNNNPN